MKPRGVKQAIQPVSLPRKKDNHRSFVEVIIDVVRCPVIKLLAVVLSEIASGKDPAK